MKLQKRVLKFEYDGNDYELNYPNVKQVLNFQKEIESGDSYEATFTLLEKLGLKKEVSETMEVGHITTIVQALTENEKK